MRKHLAAKQAEMRKRMTEPYPSGSRKRKKKEIRYFSFKAETKLDPLKSKPKIPIKANSMLLANLTVPSVLLMNEKQFAESCLPNTMRKAKGLSLLLSNILDYFPKKWTYLDKVLVYVAPSFRDEVEAYYDKDGPSMKELYDDDKLERFDFLLVDLLRNKP